MAISFSQRQYWRFLYKAPPSTFHTLAPESAVCVCVHPWAKGFPPPPLSPVYHKLSLAGGRDTAGTARPTKRVPVGAEAVEDAPLCTCLKHTDTTGPPCRCSLVPWSFFTIPSHKQVFPPHFSADRELQLEPLRHRSQGKQPMFKHLQFVGLFTMLFHRHLSHRGNRDN